MTWIYLFIHYNILTIIIQTFQYFNSRWLSLTFSSSSSHTSSPAGNSCTHTGPAPSHLSLPSPPSPPSPPFPLFPLSPPSPSWWPSWSCPPASCAWVSPRSHTGPDLPVASLTWSELRTGEGRLRCDLALRVTQLVIPLWAETLGQLGQF